MPVLMIEPVPDPKAFRKYNLINCKHIHLMKQNMGVIDKVVRILIAVTIGILYFTGRVSGTAGILLLILAGIFILTSFIGSCPLYLPFGISTKKNKS